MAKRLRHVTIVGVGLLGGSVAMGLKRAYGGIHVAGVGRRQSSLDEALGVGAIDSAHLDVAECVGRSDLVVLCTPVGAFGDYLLKIKPLLKTSAIVTDVGSTKREVVGMAAAILGRKANFVGSHPMAGSETKGVRFARADLLCGATCIVTPAAATPAPAVRFIQQMWKKLGMRVVQMDPRRHDQAVAAISHLPHALSALLMLMPKGPQMDVAAGGFRDMTRLAGGDSEMWRDIFATNRRPILDAIDSFQRRLLALRESVERGELTAIETLLDEARLRRSEFVTGRKDCPPARPKGRG